MDILCFKKRFFVFQRKRFRKDHLDDEHVIDNNCFPLLGSVRFWQQWSREFSHASAGDSQKAFISSDVSATQETTIITISSTTGILDGSFPALHSMILLPTEVVVVSEKGMTCNSMHVCSFGDRSSLSFPSHLATSFSRACGACLMTGFVYNLYGEETLAYCMVGIHGSWVSNSAVPDGPVHFGPQFSVIISQSTRFSL